MFACGMSAPARVNSWRTGASFSRLPSAPMAAGTEHCGLDGRRSCAHSQLMKHTSVACGNQWVSPQKLNALLMHFCII